MLFIFIQKLGNFIPKLSLLHLFRAPRRYGFTRISHLCDHNSFYKHFGVKVSIVDLVYFQQCMIFYRHGFKSIRSFSVGDDIGDAVRKRKTVIAGGKAQVGGD